MVANIVSVTGEGKLFYLSAGVGWGKSGWSYREYFYLTGSPLEKKEGSSNGTDWG